MSCPSQPTRATNLHAEKTLKVMYLFAGNQRHSDIGAFLRKAEKSLGFKLVLMEFDIERSPDHDLTDDGLWERIYTLLKEGDWTLIVSPPCNTFSRARFQHQQHPGPKPGSGQRVFLCSMTGTRRKWRRRICLLHGCELAASHQGFFILEHPEDLGTVRFDLAMG